MEQNELIMQIAELLEKSEERTAQRIKELESRIGVKIENEVTKRIDALFDGYKLTHEKQWELERQTESLQSQIDELKTRLAALENRTA